MILVKIPNWVNYLIVEMDKTIWGHRYDPNSLTMPNQKSYSSAEQSEIIGIIHGSATTGTTKINSIIENEDRYINQHMQVVTKANQDYKEFTLETFLLKQGEK